MYHFLYFSSTGLLTSNGDKWKGRRRLLTPAFHFDILDRTLSTMIEHTRVALSLFHTHATHDSFVDIWEAMSLLGMRIGSEFELKEPFTPTHATGSGSDK